MNIYLLPTREISKIYKTRARLHFEEFPTKDINVGNQHVYITSNEEIREGDWYYDTNDDEFSFPIYRRSQDLKFYSGCKKIILTTDPKLIKDGVQAIDDKFLKWFVKNPSCEEVEVKPLRKSSGWYDEKEIWHWDFLAYNIIIPKEEHKQETLEEARVVKRTELYNSILSIVKQIPRKDVEFDAMDAPSCAYELEQLFYKWQQERSYNEKDLKKAFEAGSRTCWADVAQTEREPYYDDFEEWFNKFKKNEH